MSSILDKIPAPLIAAGRYAITFATGAIAATSGAHIINQTDAAALTAAVNNIASGVTSIAGGIATIAGFAASFYGAWSATRSSRLNSVAADPTVKNIVVTSPEIAAAAPSNKVVSQ